LPRNAQKSTKKKIKKEGTYVLFFASWRRCTSFSRFIFSAAPWVAGEPEPDRRKRKAQGQEVGKMLRIGLGANSPVSVPSTMY
jgi:hypothetical protein